MKTDPEIKRNTTFEKTDPAPNLFSKSQGRPKEETVTKSLPEGSLGGRRSDFLTKLHFVLNLGPVGLDFDDARGTLLGAFSVPFSLIA